MKTEAEKNPAAVALARLRAGVKERPSARKRAAVLANLEKARALRWPAKPKCSVCGAPIVGEGNIGGRCHNTEACKRRAVLWVKPQQPAPPSQ